jgi:hypothetical protein
MIGFAVLFCTAPAKAETVNIDVSSGRKVEVGNFAFYDLDSCASGGKPKITYYQPEHGTITSTWARLKFASDHKCRGKPINGLIIYYQSKGGYRGVDRGSYVVSFPEFTNGSGFKAYTYKVNANVK